MNNRGFAMVEIVLALTVLAIISTGLVTLGLQSFSFSTKSTDQAKAVEYSKEGIEAVRAIRNRNFYAITAPSNNGLAISGSVWAFSGTSNTFESGKYTRVVNVANVNRDGSGNVVSSGGTLDADSMKVTSTTSWNLNASRTSFVTLTTYLTNWGKAIQTLPGGMLVYGNGSTTSDAMQFKTLSNLNVWSSASSMADVDAATSNRALRLIKVFDSTTRNEKVALSRHYNGTTQYIYGQVYNGSTWGNIQVMSSWTAATFLDVQNFDGTYLANGSFMVVFSDNTVIPKMRVWTGSAWGGQSSLTTLGTSQIPSFVVLKTRPSTNEVMASFFTQGLDAITQYYSGTAWGTRTTHFTSASLNNTRKIDFEWNSGAPLTGFLSYSGNAGFKRVSVRKFTANGSGGGAWGTALAIVAQTLNIGSLALVVSPISSEVFVCNKGTTTPFTIVCKRTSSVPATLAITNGTMGNSDAGNQMSFDLALEGLTKTQALAVYSDNTAVPKAKLYTFSTGTLDASATSISMTPFTLTSPLRTLRTKPLTAADDIMVLMGDTGRGLYSVVWNGTSNAVYSTPAGLAVNQHGTNGSSGTEYWYDFTWDQ